MTKYGFHYKLVSGSDQAVTQLVTKACVLASNHDVLNQTK